MKIKQYITEILTEATAGIAEEEGIKRESLPKIRLEHPKRSEHGDYSSSVAFALARSAGRKPHEIADRIIANIRDYDRRFEKIMQINGYINFCFKLDSYYEILKYILVSGKDFARLDAGKGQRVLIEFVSANPTGPLHVGHGRGAIFGDVLSRVLSYAGYNVTKEYYINDAGSQVASLGRSVASRYFALFGKDFEAGEYRGDYIDRIAEMIREDKGDYYLSEPVDRIIAEFSIIASQEIMKQIKHDLGMLGIEMDSWVSEKEFYEKGKVDKVINHLKEGGHTKIQDGALWFKSSDFVERFGDIEDRVLVRANGEKTYFASDVAYHDEKYERGFELLVNIWGADHHGYLPRLKSALHACNRDTERLKVIFLQMVSLFRNGTPVQMSKRSGEYITLRELIEEVGSDSARFLFLTREPGAKENFDIELAKKHDSNNPVYYVQYAHARICSVLREAENAGIDILEPSRHEFKALNLSEEKKILRKILYFADEIERSVTNYEVHNISYFLIELANDFHKYYNSCRIIGADRALTMERLMLIKGIKTVFELGLSLLGITAPEKM